MKYSTLGRSGLEVSRVCLGTMTWGTQNNQGDADAQLAYALDQGINFVDTAEMYSIPPAAETSGNTERIIGDWLARNAARRADFILATKIVGVGLPWIRDGGPITGATVIEAVDGSLQRLQTDYIDLYQLHWPNRSTPHFGRHWPGAVQFSEAQTQQEIDSMHDILQGLKKCVDAGKIIHCGLSDDTPWGISQFMRLGAEHDLPLMTSIQNEFNLLCSKDHPYLIEQCLHENIAFLPWSPLASGVLSGKYLNGQRPAGSRWTLSSRQGFFRDTEAVEAAVKAYQSLAAENNMTVAQLALKWVDNIEGVTSTIIGATSQSQLKENIEAFSFDFSDELTEKLDGLFRRHAMAF